MPGIPITEVEMNHYVFGPLPSRRLGRSVGISPIPPKTCNYSCVYCQLGRTSHLDNTRKRYYPVEAIMAEFDAFLASGIDYDVVSVVGEGEPTLYADLAELIEALKAAQQKPVCVITNAANIDQQEVQTALMAADIVLPSLDAVDEPTWRRMHRPARRIDSASILEALIEFSHRYTGQLWLEVMLLAGYNDSKEAIDAIADQVARMRTDRVYVNVPARPPAESDVAIPSEAAIRYACERLGASAIDHLTSGEFHSAEKDPLAAVQSITMRHPMTAHEIDSLLAKRGVTDRDAFYARLAELPGMVCLDYKGMKTWRNRSREK